MPTTGVCNGPSKEIAFRPCPNYTGDGFKCEYMVTISGLTDVDIKNLKAAEKQLAAETPKRIRRSRIPHHR